MQTKNAAFELKREPDANGEFEGYASVFGVVDQGMQVVAPGAFGKSLGSGRNVKMLWQHDPSQIIGVWDEIKENERGLFVKGRLLKDVRLGAEAITLMRAGAIDSMSIGYRTIEAANEADGRVRKLMEIDLFEISLVTFPMLREAQVTAVKSIQTERHFEGFLRDAGYSRKDAVAITLHGFKAYAAQRDAAEDDGQSEAALRDLMNRITKLGNKINV
jgi:HK97 family phage prohead protease